MSKPQEKKVVVVTGMKTINISNRDFINRLNPAFSELAMLKSNPDSGELKYSIKRSMGSMQDAVDRFNKKRIEIFEERAKKDEEGNAEFDKNKNYLFKSEKLKKEAFAELEKLEKEIIRLIIYPVSMENIIKATKQDLSIAMEYNLGEYIEYPEGSDDAKFIEEMKLKNYN